MPAIASARTAAARTRSAAAACACPTLEEALAAFPDARFNLELKEGVPGLVEALRRA